MKSKLSFIGDLTVDIYPQLQKTNLGGSSFTSAMWAKKLGAECTILASVGNDEAGKSYRDFFKKNHLSCSHLRFFTHPTSNIEIFIDKFGEHTFGDWQPGAYAKYHLGIIEMDFLKTQDAVVMPLYFKTKHLLEELVYGIQYTVYGNNKTANRTPQTVHPKPSTVNCKPQTSNRKPYTANRTPYTVIDFDDLSQFGKSQKIIEDYLPYIDIVKLGLDIDIDCKLIAEIKHLAASFCIPNPPNPPKLPKRPNHPKIFLITLNKNGSVVFYQGKEYWQKADKITVKNSTGAGDAFIAGFLVEYLKPQTPQIPKNPQNSQIIQNALKQGTKTASKHLTQQSSHE